MLGQEFEDVVPHKVLIVFLSNAKYVGNPRRIKLDGEVGVFDDKILPYVSNCLRQTRLIAWCYLRICGIERLHLAPKVHLLNLP